MFVNPFVDRDRAARAWVAGALLPAFLLFGLGSALEVFHPVEESLRHGEPLHAVDESRAAIHAHDAPAFDHDHHFCAHANAVAHVARLGTAFESAGAFVPLAWNASDRPTSSVLAVLDRGPPVLL